MPSQDSTPQTYMVRNRHILTEANEWIDCSQDEIDAAISKRNEWAKQKNEAQQTIFTNPNGKSIRSVRPKQRGLLLIYPLDPSAISEDKQISVFPDGDKRRFGKPIIGYAISFPESNSIGELEDVVEYMVNQTYINEELDGYRQEEELENDAT